MTNDDNTDRFKPHDFELYTDHRYSNFDFTRFDDDHSIYAVTLEKDKDHYLCAVIQWNTRCFVHFHWAIKEINEKGTTQVGWQLEVARRVASKNSEELYTLTKYEVVKESCLHMMTQFELEHLDEEEGPCIWYLKLSRCPGDDEKDNYNGGAHLFNV